MTKNKEGNLLYDNMYVLNSVYRYGDRIRHCNESVAAHSFFVSWFSIRACNMMQVSDNVRLRALETAILHDTPEAFTTDITAKVKQMFPAIKQVFSQFEYESISAESKDAARVLFSLPDDKSLDDELAYWIVKWADLMSVKQYCVNEINMGNEMFKDIYDENNERIERARFNLDRAYMAWKGEQDA